MISQISDAGGPTIWLQGWPDARYPVTGKVFIRFIFSFNAAQMGINFEWRADPTCVINIRRPLVGAPSLKI